MIDKASFIIILFHNSHIMFTQIRRFYVKASIVIPTVKDLPFLGSLFAAAHQFDLSKPVSVLKFSSSDSKYASIEQLIGALKAKRNDTNVWLMAHSSWGKSLAPAFASSIGTLTISDVVYIGDQGDLLKRPTYAGNALQAIRRNKIDSHSSLVLTIRCSAFEPIEDLQVEDETFVLDNDSSIKLIDESITGTSRPDLGAAEIVIAGGRALQSTDNFRILERLADVFGSQRVALGASRAAVDAGYAPNEWQVGQTGRIVAPKLYIAVGISGAIQHVAGMKDSACIVAINKDADAPIFKVADYGLAGDLFKITPELTQKLSTKNK